MPAVNDLSALLDAQYGVEPLREFIGRLTEGRYPSPDHVAPLREQIELSRHRPVQVAISLPPRHAKTFTIQMGLVWRLLHDPACSYAYVTSGGDMAHEKSEQIRDYARQAGVQLGGRTAVRNWSTSYGGGLRAVGIGGQYTGAGTTGIQVFDDPYSTVEAANSAAYRRKVWNYFNGVARHRVQPGGSRIVCHTRWHQEDLIGLLRKHEPGDWVFVDIPAVQDFDEQALTEYQALKRRGQHKGFDLSRIGKALWPEYWPIRELLPHMAARYFWWSQFMQSPRALGERVFDEPARFDLGSFDWTGWRGCIGVDPAATASRRSDHSAIVVMAARGYGPTSEYRIVDRRSYQVQIPELARRLRDIQRCYRLLLVIEAVGGFKAVPQVLRDVDPSLRIHEVHPSSDKFLRAQPLAAAWNDGRVAVPSDAEWVDEYLENMMNFTGLDDPGDDDVDATAHDYNALYRAAPPRGSGWEGNSLPYG